MPTTAKLSVRDLMRAANLRHGMDGPRDPWLLWSQKMPVTEGQLLKFCEMAREEALGQIALEYKLSASTGLSLRERLARIKTLRSRDITKRVESNLKLRAPAVSSVIPAIIMAWLIRTVLTMIIEYIISEYVLADGDLTNSGRLN